MFALPSDAQAIFEAAKAKVSFRTLTVLIVKCLLNEDEELNNYYFFLEFRQQKLPWILSCVILSIIL